MTSAFRSSPSEDDLRRRISRQIDWRGETKEVVLIWRGYLAALFEWGAIELGAYERLSKLLPSYGAGELFELFGDEKNTPEQEMEIERHKDT